MEARWTSGQPLTLAAWTHFIGALSDQQAAPLRITPSSLTRFPKQRVASAITMLRLYASLDEADRIRARSGGLPLSGLDTRRREIALRAIRELGERGALGPAYLHAQVPGRSLPEEIWFVVTEDSSPAGDWFHEPGVAARHPRAVYRFELRPLGGSTEGILAVDRG